jgi:hypothetical protein
MPSELEPEAPELIKQLRWLQVHGKNHWKLIVIALVTVLVIPVYNLATTIVSKPKSMGEFQIVIENQLRETLKVGELAEFYLSAPETPAMNRQVSSGLIRLSLPDGMYQLTVEPGQTVKSKASLVNEARLLPYLDAGEFFGLIIFSASPKPIRTEILFTRKEFENGIYFGVKS